MPSSDDIPTSNGDWLAGLRTHSEQAITALRARIRDGLGAAFRADVTDADLDDFTQDAVLRVLDRLDSFRGDSGFTTWAMSIAVRIGMTALRRRRFAATPLDDRLAQLALPDAATGASHDAGERGELLAALRQAIDAGLTPRQRQVLLGELDGIPQVVLAERLATTPGAVYKVSHDARRKLKTALTAAGFDGPTVLRLLADGHRVGAS